MDLIEVVLDVGYSLVGIVLGSILNPWDTLTNIPGGLLLMGEVLIEAVLHTASDLIAIFALGLIAIQPTTPTTLELATYRPTVPSCSWGNHGS